MKIRKDCKCAVIGACGYIGKHIVKYLESRYGIIAETYDVCELNAPHYRMIDLTDRNSVELIDLNVDYIFDFAGLTGTFAGFDKYETYMNVNELGLLNLLDAIRKSPYNPKLIFPSTRLVYKGEDKYLNEDDEKETKTIYAVNKLACEGLLYAFKQSFDIRYSVFRICIPYGNLLSKDYSFGTIGFFIRQAQAGKNITLYGGGTVKRTFTHMDDLCYQIVEGSFAEASDGQTYNVGGQTLALSDAAQIIADKYNVSVEPVSWPERDLRIESSHTYFNDSKIRKLLNITEYKQLADFANDL